MATTGLTSNSRKSARLDENYPGRQWPFIPRPRTRPPRRPRKENHRMLLSAIPSRMSGRAPMFLASNFGRLEYPTGMNGQACPRLCPASQWRRGIRLRHTVSSATGLSGQYSHSPSPHRNETSSSSSPSYFVDPERVIHTSSGMGCTEERLSLWKTFEFRAIQTPHGQGIEGHTA
jgi:hypothetical protein